MDLQAAVAEGLPTEREASVHSDQSDATMSSCIVVGGSRQIFSSTPPSTTTRATSVSIDESSKDLMLIVARQRSPHREDSPVIKVAPVKETSRALSGETLVESDAIRVSTPATTMSKAMGADETSLEAEEDPQTRDLQRRASKPRAARITEAAKATAGRLVAKASVLGKRGFEALETGTTRVGAFAASKSARSRQQARADTKVKRRYDNEGSERPAKRSRVSGPAPSTHSNRDNPDGQAPSNAFERYKGKLWLTSGLYVGQEQDFNPKTNHSARKGNVLPAVEGEQRQRRILPLPMFGGKRLLENGRGFRLPYDVCSPLPPGQSKPEEWRKTQKNVFVGDAATEWRYHKNLAHSQCLCTVENGCDESCQNRYMLYECDDTNCNLGKDNCTNRAFADLKERMKSGNKFDIGVEVVKTADKGFGVRSNRMFEAGQIIMEYAGEIITQEECERRMRQEYKNNECYYLMVFDQNMIIDATRGSIARFVNHSCDPNCRMVKWTVAGKPRMALFAGDGGVLTGEELSYDYNFDPFSQKNVQICRCGAATCRGILGPRPPGGSAPKLPESLLAGTKRKIMEVFSQSSAKTSNQTQPKSKKSRVEQPSVITVASAPGPPVVAVKVARQKPGWYWEPVKNTKKERIMSGKDGGSTLLDKDNIISGRRRRTVVSVNQVQSPKKGKLARTVSLKGRHSRPARVLARVSMKVKRATKVAAEQKPV